MSELTPEQIEFVARAICMAENDDPCGATFDASDENERNRYRWLAKNALIASAIHLEQRPSTDGRSGGASCE